MVNLPLTSSVYFKMVTQFVHPVRRWKDWFALQRVRNGKFIGMGEIDDEGRVAPRRPVVEYPA